MRIFPLLLFLALSSCAQSGGNVPVHSYGDSGAKGSLGLHTIRSGETLWAISQSYHVELRDLLDLNRLSPPYAMTAGERIKIPAPRTYTVQKGDTLYRVSRMFATTTTDLARLNSLKSPYVLSKGQALRLPSLRRAVVSSPPPVSSPVQVAAVEPVERESLPQQKATPVAAPASVASVAISPAPQRSSSGFLTPVSGRVISSYGPKKDGLHNDGINIKAPRGTSVRAAENGVVVYSGNEIEGYGNLVLVRHSGGYVTAYAHMDKSLVKKGAVLKRGQAIGTVGSTGHVSTPQLHFEIRKGKKALNPEPMIRI